MGHVKRGAKFTGRECARAVGREGAMRRLVMIAPLLLSMVGCVRAGPVRAPTVAKAEMRAEPRERVDRATQGLFAAEEVEGVFVLRSLDTEEQIVTDAVMAGTGELPASTFKIPNALLALEYEVLTGADSELKWDGVKRWAKEWDRDHSLASALRDSTVWFFQEVARRIGAEAMQAGLSALEYGNADIGGGIDEFWLSGQLRITPREQVGFMARLHRRELPVATEHMALVEHLLTREQGMGWSWRGKTGLTAGQGRAVGWLVGLSEWGEKRWAYALLVRAPEAELERLIALRPRLARALLVHYGALPAG